MFSSNLLSKFQKCSTSLRLHSHLSFLSGTSSQYIEDMYNAWLKDPKSVHASWDSFFKNSTLGLNPPYEPPPNLIATAANLRASMPQQGAALTVDADKTIEDHLAVQSVIRSYQARGHLVAKVDPLEYASLTPGSTNVLGPADILRVNKLDNLDKVYRLPGNTFIGGENKKLPLREIIKRLEEAYCQHIGVEYMYIDELEQRSFIREKMETPGIMKQTVDQKRLTLKRLIRAREFENFLSKKWHSEKRFGIEGCDTFIPMVKQIVDKSTDLGVENFFLGMSHRGRLNLLANIFRQPLYQIFNQFAPLEPGDIGQGDVKYHFGAHAELINAHTSKEYKLTLLSNASHLESVNAIVLGRTRAEQVLQGDDQGKKSIAILIHGDAAFSGQGVNYESLGLSYLPDYTTHGNICIIVNNQLGFTTDPHVQRSSRYCSDLGHVVHAPIFHVNADDPESVVHVANVAAEWRAKFHRDIVIDLVGYRKHGHNEADEPMFTQPLMYTKIKQMKPSDEKYVDQLTKEKVVTTNEVAEMRNQYIAFCEQEFVKASQQTQLFLKYWLDSPWSGFFEGKKDSLKVVPTGIPEPTITHILKKFCSPPPENLGFVMHKGLNRMLELRRQAAEQRSIDWSMCEALAIGSLVKEGIPVRLSGQDVERGTFSHRHHVLHHQEKDKVTYKPLDHLFPDQARYTVCNSSLSEYGVLGFETGYAQANPNCLVMWEAQFADFFNTAQCIFDQYLAAGETKWMRQNGLVVLLPHSYEGMGPEHTSGRPERFLQLCDDDPDVMPPITTDFAIKQLKEGNWIIANCSTPANMFHILRRQIALPFRKPLIIFTPKSLLRLRECRSPFEEIMEGTEFKRVIPESGPASKDPKGVKKLLLCSGKVYYDITAARTKRNLEKEIAVTTIEQLFPFPYDLLKIEVEKYSNAKVCWAQEDTKNGGAYQYALLRLNTLLRGSRPVNYIGRAAAASPATGIKHVHKAEVENLAREFMEL